MKRNYTNPAIEAVPLKSSSAMLTPTADVSSLDLAYYTGMATATLKASRNYPVTLILTKKQK